MVLWFFRCQEGFLKDSVFWPLFLPLAINYLIIVLSFLINLIKQPSRKCERVKFLLSWENPNRNRDAIRPQIWRGLGENDNFSSSSVINPPDSSLTRSGSNQHLSWRQHVDVAQPLVDVVPSAAERKKAVACKLLPSQKQHKDKIIGGGGVAGVNYSDEAGRSCDCQTIYTV